MPEGNIINVVLLIILRSVAAFFALLVLVRLMGKQQVAEMTFFDYVVGITIGSIAATMSVAFNENTLATFFGMIVWTVLPILIAYLSVHHVWIRKIVEGEATIVVQNGRILEKNLQKLRLSIDDLIAQLRIQGVFNLADVEVALLEPNGRLSVQKCSQKLPLTPSDMGISTAYEGLPTNLIEDGQVLDDALRSLKLSKAWLQYQLAQRDVVDFGQVSLAQLDTKGNLYVDLQGDRPFFTIPTVPVK